MRNDSLTRGTRTHNEPACIEKIDSHMVVAYPRPRPLFRSMMPINVVQPAPVLNLCTFIPVVWISFQLSLVYGRQHNEQVSLVFLHCLIIPEDKSDISYILVAILIKLTG